MTLSYIKYVKILHELVIHNSKLMPSQRQVNAEEKHIKRIDDNELYLICERCFRDPD